VVACPDGLAFFLKSVFRLADDYCMEKPSTLGLLKKQLRRLQIKDQFMRRGRITDVDPQDNLDHR
jgi:hypothetical protein